MPSFFLNSKSDSIDAKTLKSRQIQGETADYWFFAFTQPRFWLTLIIWIIKRFLFSNTTRSYDSSNPFIFPNFFRFTNSGFRTDSISNTILDTFVYFGKICILEAMWFCVRNSLPFFFNNDRRLFVVTVTDDVTFWQIGRHRKVDD